MFINKCRYHFLVCCYEGCRKNKLRYADIYIYTYIYIRINIYVYICTIGCLSSLNNLKGIGSLSFGRQELVCPSYQCSGWRWLGGTRSQGLKNRGIAKFPCNISGRQYTYHENLGERNHKRVYPDKWWISCSPKETCQTMRCPNTYLRVYRWLTAGLQ